MRGPVRYAAPEGHHDDCAIALALAVERARRYCPVGGIVVVHGSRPSFDEWEGGVRAWYEEMRKDPEWGWEPRSRYGWN